MTMKDFDLEVKKVSKRDKAERKGVSAGLTTVILTSYLEGCTGNCTNYCSKNCTKGERCGYSMHTHTCNAVKPIKLNKMVAVL